MPNGIDLIRADHKTVNELFERFAETRDGAFIGQVIDALQAHDEVEQAALYPLTAEVLADEDLLTRTTAAHTVVKKLIVQFGALEGPPLRDAFAALEQAVSAHVADEEAELLPALEKRATPAQLDELGARIEQVKQRVG